MTTQNQQICGVQKIRKEKLDHGLRVYENMLDLLPSPDNPTPMVRLSKRINPYENFDIFIKLERFNPFGSIKDRIAKYMIDKSERKDYQTIVEATSGNTGIGLAGVANILEIPIEVVIPEEVPEEKKTLLRLLGTQINEVSDSLCPLKKTEGARAVASDMVNDSFFRNKYIELNQYNNENNWKAHYHTTGPEIWKQTNGKINFFFAGIGTGGTISGIGKYLKDQDPSIKIIGVEPANSNHKIPGLKNISDLEKDLVPKILDESVIDEIVKIEDDDAYATGIRLARKDSILAGPSTGAALHLALQYAEKYKGLAVTISPDDAFKSISFYENYLREKDNHSSPIQTSKSGISAEIFRALQYPRQRR